MRLTGTLAKGAGLGGPGSEPARYVRCSKARVALNKEVTHHK